MLTFGNAGETSLRETTMKIFRETNYRETEPLSAQWIRESWTPRHGIFVTTLKKVIVGNYFQLPLNALSATFGRSKNTDSVKRFCQRTNWKLV